MTLTLQGGAGNDALSVTDYAAGSMYRAFGSNTSSYAAFPAGVTSASLDGGMGDDLLRASGVLHLSLTGGSGADTFALTAQQYRTLLEGTRSFQDSSGVLSSVTADPTVITDFEAGAGRDVLDFTDLMGNAALGYDGANPYAAGFLKLTQSGADTLLSFDADGAAGQASTAVTVAVLKHTNAVALVASNFSPSFSTDGAQPFPQTLGATVLADSLTGGLGSDTVAGLAGNDTIDGQAGSDSIDGGDGDDWIVGGLGNDTLLGGAGNDTISDDQGTNLLDGGPGNDQLSAQSITGSQTLIGGEGDDALTASMQRNVDGIYSYLSGGNADLSGGAGNDRLYVLGYSSTNLSGGDGNDNLLVVSSRVVFMAGGGGDDYLNAQVFLYTESVVMDGGDGNDSLSVDGSGGASTTVSLLGGSGNDVLTVTSFGTFASASLDGGAGDDVLIASGVGHLSLTGGAGADTFKITAQQYRTLLAGVQTFYVQNSFTAVAVAADATVITDFAVGAGMDLLDYSDLLRNAALGYDGSNPFSSGFLKLAQSGADTLLSFDADGAAGQASSSVTLAVLKNLNAADLAAGNLAPNFSVSGVTRANTLPAGTLTITGQALRSYTLVAANSLSDVDGMGPVSYRWLADGMTITGASGNTLLLGQQQVGASVTVVASYADSLGTAESVTSAATAVVANVNDLPRVA